MSQARDAADLPTWKILVGMAIQTVLFASFGALLWTLADRPVAGFVSFSLREVGLGLALAAALIMTSAALAWRFPAFAEWLVRSQADQYPFLKNRLSIAAIALVSIGAGVGEEALFRGGFQTLFAAYLPLPLALALASGLFAAVHFARPINSVLIFVIGCLFGAVYWATGSLLAVMIGHAVYDVYALWALQEALHRLGVFDEKADQALRDKPADETLTATTRTTGENP